jgi:type IV pilus assembly protein PilE
MRTRAQSGFTVSEMLTALVAIVVMAAIAIPLWRTHELRTRRGDAVESLLAVQEAQDQFFAKNARYANEEELGIKATSDRGFYRLSLSSTSDELGYWAVARVIAHEGQSADTRCVELRLDQNGRRFAVDAGGADRSADCWR